MTENTQASTGFAPSKKRRRFLLLLTAIFALSAGVVSLHQREVRIGEVYAGLPLAFEDNLGSMQDRLLALDQFIMEHPFSRGGFQAERERHGLQLEVYRLEQQEAEDHIEESSRLADLEGQAESLRLRGIELAENGDLARARETLQASLDVGLSRWDKRLTVQEDIRAIDAWLAMETGQ